MFTGIIQDVGVLQSMANGRLVVATAVASGDANDIRLGDSVAVSGVCLTVVEHTRGRLAFDVSPETLRRASLGALRPGAPLNIERALRLGDRLDGHIVQGHVDGLGRLVSRSRSADGWEIVVELPEDLRAFVVAKGSIALDGVSLTVATLDDPGRGALRVSVAVVPHTADHTILAQTPVGAPMNVETDILGRYVARLLQVGGQLGNQAGGQAGATRAEGLTLDALAKGGFLDR